MVHVAVLVCAHVSAVLVYFVETSPFKKYTLDDLMSTVICWTPLQGSSVGRFCKLF